MPKKSPIKIELLAPAKNLEIGIAAINSGADAVYISPEKFGARENAGNSIHDIAKLVSYAHKFYVRVYAALNTIFHDKELKEVERLINQLYEIGVDALIIQDVGLLELDLPDIPFFASTQMNNDTSLKVRFLEQIGFKRAILARELTLSEIKDIHTKTTIELECFIHGALCVSYSGQCYLSYAIGGRSGNRGNCAQPCRRQYSLCDSNKKTIIKNRYLLSLRDLNRSNYLKELINAGITSFKIEGRLKDMAYVTNIVSYYRIKLDEILDDKNFIKSSSGKTEFNFVPNPYKTFNRGYTDYGLVEVKNKLANLNTPKSIGEQIGTVIGVNKDSFAISQSNDLHNGDGLCFFDSDKNLRGTIINQIQNNIIYPDKIHYIKKNTVIYRNYDRVFIKQIEQSSTKRHIIINLTLSESADGFRLEAQDEDGNIADFSISIKKKIAEKKESVYESIRKQLLKLGDTIFICSKLDIHLNVKKIEPAAESGLDMNGKLVMITKYCIKRELNLCEKDLLKEGITEPIYLIDNDNRYYLLKFNCEICKMEIYFS
ncbi:U32 family peptidase [Candidatus Poribacteria bacterium]|nr:U32 family peptidase [Candidatus Poribacteria bacterium]